MMRKLGMVVVVVFFGYVNMNIQLLVALGVVLLAGLAHVLYSPYRLERLNVLEKYALYVVGLIVYLALLFLDPDTNAAFRTTISFILVGLNTAMMVVFVAMIVYEFFTWMTHGLDRNDDGNVTDEELREALAEKIESPALQAVLSVFYRRLYRPVARALMWVVRGVRAMRVHMLRKH